MHRQEMLQTRIPALENLYEVKFRIKGTVQKNNTSNTYVKKNISRCETTVASTDKNGSIILNINENSKHPVNENKGKEETSTKLEDSEIINFTINKSNVYNESNALETTNATEQEKVDIVRKQMETSEKEYTRLTILQSKQQHEFNNKIEAEQIRIRDELNQIKSTINPSEIETQIIFMRREIERGLKDKLNIFKDKF